MPSAQMTPPDSPTQKPRVYVQEQTGDIGSHELTGNTKFPLRGDVHNILITGGAGFIGGWVTRHLTMQYPDYNVVCFDKLDRVASRANVGCLEHLPNFEFVQGDIASKDDVSRVLEEHKIDCVMHFAASSHVQNSFSDAESFTYNNVVGTHVLLECIRHYGKINRLVHVSTDEVYGETNGEFLDENHQFLPTNPYSASKAAAEMYVHAYAKSFDIPTIIVRSNNVYGPCQYPEKIIPKFFCLLSEGKSLTIQGSGLNSRRYLYGGDAADAFDVVLHKGEVGEAYNVGSQYEVTNLEVAVRMLQLFGCTPKDDFNERLRWIEDRPFNDFDYRVDGSKLLDLGWEQSTSFEKGLTNTVNWYRKNMSLWWEPEDESDGSEVSATQSQASSSEVDLVNKGADLVEKLDTTIAAREMSSLAT